MSLFIRESRLQNSCWKKKSIFIFLPFKIIDGAQENTEMQLVPRSEFFSKMAEHT